MTDALRSRANLLLGSRCLNGLAFVCMHICVCVCMHAYMRLCVYACFQAPGRYPGQHPIFSPWPGLLVTLAGTRSGLMNVDCMELATCCNCNGKEGMSHARPRCFRLASRLRGFPSGWPPWGRRCLGFRLAGHRGVAFAWVSSSKGGNLLYTYMLIYLYIRIYVYTYIPIPIPTPV